MWPLAQGWTFTSCWAPALKAGVCILHCTQCVNQMRCASRASVVRHRLKKNKLHVVAIYALKDVFAFCILHVPNQKRFARCAKCCAPASQKVSKLSRATGSSAKNGICIMHLCKYHAQSAQVGGAWCKYHAPSAQMFLAQACACRWLARSWGEFGSSIIRHRINFFGLKCFSFLVFGLEPVFGRFDARQRSL